MNFKMIAAAAAFLAAGAANASLSQMDGGAVNGNSSVLLVKLDSSTTAGAATQGLVVDLGFNYSDFANNGALSQAGQSVVWNFDTNTISLNGNVVSGISNAWSSAFATFAANSDAADTKWAIVAGSQQGNAPAGFLASGTPTSTQLTQQSGTLTSNMVKVNPLFSLNATKGTLGSADNGAYSMGSTDSGYVGNTAVYGPTTANGWVANIKWSTWNLDGASTNLTQLNPNGSEVRVGDAATFAGGAAGYDTTGLLNASGTFKLVGNTLTWQTASAIAVTPSVPEPESFVLALAGLAGLVVARRRATK